MKNNLLIIIGIILLVIMFSGKKEFKKMAGECNNIPTDGCTVSSSTTFTPGVYNLPNGIIINANNVVLDCNGASLVGSNITGSEGISSYLHSNIVIKNCNIADYYGGMHIDGASNNILIENNTVSSSIYMGIQCSSSNLYNCTITNNKIYDYNISSKQEGIKLWRTHDSEMSYNYVYGANTDMVAQGDVNSKIHHNILDGPINFKQTMGGGLVIRESTTEYPHRDSVVYSNVISNRDRGINVHTVINCTIRDNILNNIVLDSDGYNIGIYIYRNSINVTLINNQIEYGHIGIWAQQSSNIFIYNTICNQVSLQDIVNGRINDVRNGFVHYYEPTACILLGEQYEGWTGDSTETTNDYISKFRTYAVTNVVVDGITANENVQTYIHTVGLFGNVSYNIPPYWYRAFWAPDNMTDKDEFYNSNSWDELKIVPTKTSGITNMFVKSQTGMWTRSYDRINYSISKSRLYFKNVNSTTWGLQLFSLTSPSKIYKGGTMVAQDVAEYSSPILPDEEIIVEYGSSSSSGGGGGGGIYYPPPAPVVNNTNTSTPTISTPAQPKKESNWLAYTLVVAAAIYFMRKK